MQTADTARRIVLALEDKVDPFLDDLRRLTSIDCPTGYKTGLDDVAEVLDKLLVRTDMVVEVMANPEAGNDLSGTVSGSGSSRILILCHTDTVYPVGTAAQRPFKIQNGHVLAPGACDMKAGILCGIYSVRALREIGFDNFGFIKILCTSDEESAPRHSVELIQKEARKADAVFCMEPARANGDIVSARKGVVVFRLDAHGREAHAGVNPDQGRNAIVALADRILQIWSFNGRYSGLSINPGLISGGSAVNTVPGAAVCSIDVRIARAADIATLESELRELLTSSAIPEVEFVLSNEHTMPPMEKTQATERLVDLARQSAAEIGFDVADTATGGGSDGAYAAETGTPVLDGLGPIGGNAHSEREFVDVSSIVPRTAMLARLISLAGSGSG